MLKEALKNDLPKHIVHRSKMGFGIPLADWFHNGIRDYAREYVIGRRDPYLSSSFVEKIWNQHQFGYTGTVPRSCGIS